MSSVLEIPEPTLELPLADDEFRYYMPLEQANSDLYKAMCVGGSCTFDTLMKSQQDDDSAEWFYEGPMSDERKDLQGETTLHKAVLHGIPNFKEMGGHVDWDHKSVGDPSFIIGIGTVTKTSPTVSLRTVLHKNIKMSQDVWRLYCARHPLFYSIGGKVLDADGKTLLKTLITHVATTLYPVNPGAAIGLPGLAKSLTDRGIIRSGRTHFDMGALTEAARDLRYLSKAITAGSGPGYEATGGRAIIDEDLEGSHKCTCAPVTTRKKPRRRRRKAVIK